MPAEVTVLLPVRNGARFLDAALASIRGQSLAALDILVIDDGSTDATPGLLRRHAAADPRLRILTQAPAGGAHGGIAAALNRGLAEASAPFVARMDADDIARPDRLARQLAFLRAHPEVAVVGSAVQVIDAAGTPLRAAHFPQDAAAIRAELAHRNPIAHPAAMLRRAAALAAGGYRAAFRQAEDYDLWLRLAETHDLRNLPELLLQLREHPAQSAWQALEQRYLSELAAQRAAAHRRRGLPDPFATAALIDRAALRAAGLADPAIAARVAARAQDSAREAARAGHPAATRAALRLAWRQPGLPLRARLRLLRTTFRCALRRRTHRPAGGGGAGGGGGGAARRNER